MYADVVNWMFRNIGGLQNGGIAYDKCRLKPYFFDDVCSASAYTQTPRGEIRFDWKRKKADLLQTLSCRKVQRLF
jgi:hypothetical protein